MNHIKVSILGLLFMSLVACKKEAPLNTVSSPSGMNTIEFLLDATGTPVYSVAHSGREVIAPSKMGFRFIGQDPLDTGLEIKNTSLQEVDEDWEMPWGEQRTVNNHFNGN